MRKFRNPIPRAPRNDPQRSRVYRMETEAIGARNYMRMSRSDVKRFVRSVCRAYGLPRVKIIYKDLGRWAAQWVEPNIIELGRKSSSRDLITLAHELAHHLHHQLSPDDTAGHGPEFMTCHMSILDMARIVPYEAMRVICRLYGVLHSRVSDPLDVSLLRRALRARPRTTRKSR